MIEQEKEFSTQGQSEKTAKKIAKKLLKANHYHPISYSVVAQQGTTGPEERFRRDYIYRLT